MVEKQRYIHKKRTFRFQEYIKISNSIIKLINTERFAEEINYVNI